MNHPLSPPSKEVIATFELFDGLPLERIQVVRTLAEAEAAAEDLVRCGAVGFDTEAKPTFHKGQKSEGPHVVQFSTLERAYIFQPHATETVPVLTGLLRGEIPTKIGFSLKGDIAQIALRFGLRCGGLVDLDRVFQQRGYRNAVGAKTAIAMLFDRRFPKSKSVTMSNWSVPELSPQQLLYAANDAYAAIRVHHRLLSL